jgi:hypothetical protein
MSAFGAMRTWVAALPRSPTTLLTQLGQTVVLAEVRNHYESATLAHAFAPKPA